MAEIIDINEFAKLDLRIGKIENAERVEVSKKLKPKQFQTFLNSETHSYSMSVIKRQKSVFVISCLLIVFVFCVILIGASAESTNLQASGVGIDLGTDDDFLMNIDKFEYNTNCPNTDTDIDDEGLKDTFEYSIEQGISYLFSTRTDPNRIRGEFAIFESSNMNMSDEVYRKINFGTPLVYHSLGFLENLTLNLSILDDIDIMRTDAISFMQRHRECDEYDGPNVLGVDTGGAVWRYYYEFGDHMLLRALFNVPDIDDTTMILEALYESGENIDDYYPTTATDYFINFQLRDAFITHNALVPPVQLQYNNFNTWTYEGIQSRIYKLEDYDVVVNANVLFFYSTQLNTSDLQTQIPEVFDYINYGIAKMNENRQKAIFPGSWTGVNISMYYPSPFTFTYFVSRAYKDGGAPITGNQSININGIKEYILADDDNDGQLDRQSTNGSWGNFELINGTKTLVTNDLETALATLSLLNIYDTLNTSDKVIANAAIDNSIEYLLENQNPDGSWDSAFWFQAPLPTRYSGSAEITTGFVLEALAKYQATRPKTTSAVSGQ